jgi:hypothetical protein
MKGKSMVLRSKAPIAAIAVAVAATASAPSLAQDAQQSAMIRLGVQLWTESYPCRDCHGGMADGIGDVPQEQGPNLRGTLLNEEQLAEIIRCGRPGTGMPYFDARAYVDDRCYGVTADQLGDLVPPRGSPGVTQRSVDALVAFLFDAFIGDLDPSKEECAAIWGPEAALCARFPSLPASDD